jgi:hypothetical protein
MSVGTMLKNSSLMSRSPAIGVYLVHVVSCRWRTRETHFPTIAPIWVCIYITETIEDYRLSWYELVLRTNLNRIL